MGDSSHKLVCQIKNDSVVITELHVNSDEVQPDTEPTDSHPRNNPFLYAFGKVNTNSEPTPTVLTTSIVCLWAFIFPADGKPSPEPNLSLPRDKSVL